MNSGRRRQSLRFAPIHEEHVLPVHGGFSKLGKGHVRLVYLADIEVDEAFDRMERFLQKHRSSDNMS